MSLSSEAEFDANTPLSGTDCDHHAIGPLDWNLLTQRFVNDVVDADFDMEIDRDIADMLRRLRRFVTTASLRCESR